MLLLFLLLFSTWVDAEARFELYNREYVKICCGEPCEELTFRIDRTLSAILFHNMGFTQRSRTYFHSQSSLLDSEFFQIIDGGEKRFRFDVRLAPPANTIITTESLPIDGTLGLGRLSPLWGVWHNYTLSSQRLILGNYDYFSQWDFKQRPPILDLNQVNYVQLGDDSLVPIDFSISSTDTYIPYPINMTKALKTVIIKSSHKGPGCQQAYAMLEVKDAYTENCMNEFTLKPNQKQDVILFNGNEYDAVQYTSTQSFIPGSIFFKEFFWFHNVITNQLIITTDAFCIDYNMVTVVGSITISLCLAFWCQIAQSKEERREHFEFFFIQMAEGMSYIIDILILGTTFIMLHWERYIVQYTTISSLYAVIFISTVVGLSGTYWLTMIYIWPTHDTFVKRFKQHGLFHALLYVTSQITVIWLCFIKHHETAFDRFSSGLVLNVALIFQLVVLMWFLTLEQFWQSLATSLLVIASNVFNIMYSILPTFSYTGMQHNVFINVVIWLFYFEVFPAVLIFVSAFTYKLAVHYKIVKS